MAANRPKLTEIHGEPSWRVSSSTSEAWVTRDGGMLGPVRFGSGKSTIEPLSVPHFAGQPLEKGMPVLIRALRGDFFCLPFGGNGTPWRGESHPPHGETANARWKYEGLDEAEGQHALRLSLQTKVRKGTVHKTITLRDGHDAMYQSHRISGVSGAMSLGHHAMVKCPDREGSGLFSTSAIQQGYTSPAPFENPEIGGYSALKVNAKFKSLSRVPLATGGTTDLSVYPARRGFEDMVMLIHKPAPFAWNAISFPKERYVFFTLKDPSVLRNTVLWLSNGGRHYAPWSGQHTNVLSIVDVTAHFADGLAESVRKNPVAEAGYPTSHKLSKRAPLDVRYLFGAVRTPAGFGRVKHIREAGEGTIALTDEAGKKVLARVDVGHLAAGA